MTQGERVRYGFERVIGALRETRGELHVLKGNALYNRINDIEDAIATLEKDVKSVCPREALRNRAPDSESAPWMDRDSRWWNQATDNVFAEEARLEEQFPRPPYGDAVASAMWKYAATRRYDERNRTRSARAIAEAERLYRAEQGRTTGGVTQVRTKVRHLAGKNRSRRSK